jgi:hypothetical protein
MNCLLGQRLDAAQRLTIGLEAEACVVRGPDAHGAAKRNAGAEWLEEARLLLGGVNAPPAAALPDA